MIVKSSSVSQTNVLECWTEIFASSRQREWAVRLLHSHSQANAPWPDIYDHEKIYDLIE